MSEPKLSPTELIAERKKAAEVAARDAWVDGNAAPEGNTNANVKPKSEPPSRSHVVLEDSTDSATKSGSGKSEDKPRRKKGLIVEHPTVRRALSKSRIQKTIRIPPMVMVEYEELCEKLGIEATFNEHINEAFGLWLDRRRK